MEQQQAQSEILVKATGQGFSIAIHGRKKEDGSWKCSLERSEITFTELPNNEQVTSLGEQRHYDRSEFEFSFETAFEKFDQSEWFLCRPAYLHADVVDFVMRAFDKRWEEYEFQFPADSPMDRFIRNNKVKEWKAKARTAGSVKS